MTRKKYRKVHINDRVWQYVLGRRFIHIRSPLGKTFNVEKDVFFGFIFGEKEYCERKINSDKFSRYSWDKCVVPSDFDIGPILYFSPKMVKQYIEAFINEWYRRKGEQISNLF